MTPFTLMRSLIVTVTVPLLAAAQVPPVRPVPQTPPKAAAPKGRPPAPSPVSPKEWEPFFHAPSIALEAFELFHEMPPMPISIELEHSMDLLRHNLDEMRFETDTRLHEELAHLDVERLKLQTERVAEQALMALPPGLLDAFGARSGQEPDKLLGARPAAPWAPDDPADSLYRVAREALNRGEYRHAALLFNEVTKQFPKSQYAQACAYWEAFSRYRLGTNEELRQALRILEGINLEALTRVARESSVDIPSLRARIQGALAARGDADAARQLQRDAAQNSGCDREEVSVRAEALNALGQMDFAAALPVVKRVLASRDECTVELRRRALYLLGRNPNSEAVPLMLDVAKNDTDASIRGEAMSWLSRIGGDQAVPLLEEMLRTSTEERTQRSAVTALASIDTERARRAVRTIIERNDAPERVRYDAIISLARERDGRAVTAEDQNYLRSLYGRLESQRIREAVLTALSRLPTPENEQFLLGIARNQNETPSLRAAAMQRLGRMSTVKLDDIAKLYDVADARSQREQILSALYQRKEPEAVDKMMEIARKDTDPRIRRYAITLLMRRNDPRVTKLLQELIDK